MNEDDVVPLKSPEGEEWFMAGCRAYTHGWLGLVVGEGPGARIREQDRVAAALGLATIVGAVMEMLLAKDGELGEKTIAQAKVVAQKVIDNDPILREALEMATGRKPAPESLYDRLAKEF